MMNNKHEALTEEQDENSIIAERRSKLSAIREKGVAFPTISVRSTKRLTFILNMVRPSARR